MVKSKLESACSGTIESITEKPEDVQLLLRYRSGQFDENNLDIDVCKSHEERLSVNFKRDYVLKRVCFWKNSLRHGETASTSRVTGTWMREVTLQECKQLMQKEDPILFPLGGLICAFCLGLLKAECQPPVEPMDESQSLTDSQDFPSQGTSRSDPDFLLSSQEQKDDRKLKLNDFNRANQHFVECRYVTETPWKNQVKSQRHHTMTIIGTSFNSVLKTISRAPGDRSELWKAAKTSRIVERLILTAPAELTDVFLEEIIRSWNGAGTNRERIVILSIVVIIYSFGYLNNFNQKPEHILDPDDSDEEFEEEQSQRKIVHFWNPKLTKYLYDQAKNHFFRHERALAPIITQPRYAFKIKEDVLNAIFDFFSSKDVVQVLHI